MTATASEWINDGHHDIEIARFVLEGDDAIEQIVSRAVYELRRTTHGAHQSFASAVSAGRQADLTAAAEALYLHVKNDYRLLYEFERTFDDSTGAQYVRTPSQTVDGSRGTCLDLVVLFSSCLANAKMWPVYVHLRHDGVDHGLCATWLKEPGPKRDRLVSLNELQTALRHGDLLILDGTGLAEGYPSRQFKLSFAEARQEGESALNKAGGDEWGFALDVRRTWETGGPRTRPTLKPSSLRSVAVLATTLLLTVLPSIDHRDAAEGQGSERETPTRAEPVFVPVLAPGPRDDVVPIPDVPRGRNGQVLERASVDPPFMVDYVYGHQGSVLLIKPVVPYLEELARSGPLSSSNADFTSAFPHLSVKVANNTDRSVVLTALEIRVKSSTPNREPILQLDSNSWDEVVINNDGWGPARQLKVDFGIVDAASCQAIDRTSRPLPFSLTVGDVIERERLPFKAYVELPPMCQQRPGGQTVCTLNLSRTVCVYGVMQYLDHASITRVNGFKTEVSVGYRALQYRKVALIESTVDVITLSSKKPGYSKFIDLSHEIRAGGSGQLNLLFRSDASALYDLSFDFKLADGSVFHSRDVRLEVFAPRSWQYAITHELTAIH